MWRPMNAIRRFGPTPCGKKARSRSAGRSTTGAGRKRCIRRSGKRVIRAEGAFAGERAGSLRMPIRRSQHSASLYFEDSERHLQLMHRLADFGMFTNLILQTLQQAVSASDVLCRLL